ncbi:hypothetical protein DFH06DRAFT_673966 [Mycena polygramma]|nr:hypothetical protein DFH06DRAFT_673966 [Mycena polygramma]
MRRTDVAGPVQLSTRPNRKTTPPLSSLFLPQRRPPLCGRNKTGLGSVHGATNLTVLATASTAFDFELLDFVGKMRLRRLAVELGTLFKDRPIMLTHPLLSSLTHLDIFDIFDRVTTEVLSDLATLLICVSTIFSPLKSWPSSWLSALAFTSWSTHSSTSFKHLAREVAENPRRPLCCFII